MVPPKTEGQLAGPRLYPTADTYPCNYCEKIFVSKAVLSEHRKGEHIPQCRHCGKVMSRFSSVRRHELSHESNNDAVVSAGIEKSNPGVFATEAATKDAKGGVGQGSKLCLNKGDFTALAGQLGFHQAAVTRLLKVPTGKEVADHSSESQKRIRVMLTHPKTGTKIFFAPGNFHVKSPAPANASAPLGPPTGAPSQALAKNPELTKVEADASRHKVAAREAQPGEGTDSNDHHLVANPALKEGHNRSEGGESGDKQTEVATSGAVSSPGPLLDELEPEVDRVGATTAASAATKAKVHINKLADIANTLPRGKVKDGQHREDENCLSKQQNQLQPQQLKQLHNLNVPSSLSITLKNNFTNNTRQQQPQQQLQQLQSGQNKENINPSQEKQNHSSSQQRQQQQQQHQLPPKLIKKVQPQQLAQQQQPQQHYRQQQIVQQHQQKHVQQQQPQQHDRHQQPQLNVQQPQPQIVQQQQQQHDRQQLKVRGKDNLNSDPTRKFSHKCNRCPMVFSSMKKHKHHVRSHEKVQERPSQPKPGSAMCEVVLVAGVLRCNTCDVDFPTRMEFRDHVKKMMIMRSKKLSSELARASSS